MLRTSRRGLKDVLARAWPDGQSQSGAQCRGDGTQKRSPSEISSRRFVLLACKMCQRLHGRSKRGRSESLACSCKLLCMTKPEVKQKTSYDNIYIYIYTCVCVCIYILYIYIYTHRCIYIYIYRERERERGDVYESTYIVVYYALAYSARACGQLREADGPIASRCVSVCLSLLPLLALLSLLLIVVVVDRVALRTMQSSSIRVPHGIVC